MKVEDKIMPKLLTDNNDIEPMNKKMTLTDVINNEEASFSKEKVKIGFF